MAATASSPPWPGTMSAQRGREGVGRLVGDPVAGAGDDVEAARRAAAAQHRRAAGPSRPATAWSCSPQMPAIRASSRAAARAAARRRCRTARLSSRAWRLFQSWMAMASASMRAGSAIIQRCRLVRCAASRSAPVLSRTRSSLAVRRITPSAAGADQRQRAHRPLRRHHAGDYAAEREADQVRRRAASPSTSRRARPPRSPRRHPSRRAGTSADSPSPGRSGATTIRSHRNAAIVWSQCSHDPAPPCSSTSGAPVAPDPPDHPPVAARRPHHSRVPLERAPRAIVAVIASLSAG